MAELKLTEEEKSSTSVLNWDEESIGKLVKKKAIENEDYIGKTTATRKAALLLLMSEIIGDDVQRAVMEIDNVTMDGEDIGDWKVTFERIDDSSDMGGNIGSGGGLVA